MDNTKECEFNPHIQCKIEGFRYLSNINGLSLLDGTYLERLITSFLKNKNLISIDGVIELENLKTPFNVKTIKGVKKILIRLKKYEALLVFEKIGKYHKQKYNIRINPEYIKFFLAERGMKL